jgi:hypothetical protein
LFPTQDLPLDCQDDCRLNAGNHCPMVFRHGKHEQPNNEDKTFFDLAMQAKPVNILSVRQRKDSKACLETFYR